MKTRPRLILLVSDQPFFHMTLQRALRDDRSNIHLIVAPDAAAALQALRSGVLVDLIMIEDAMADLERFDALADFDRLCPRTPKVLISACEADATASQARRYRVQGYFSKAWPMALFAARVEEVLNGGCRFADEAPETDGMGMTQRQIEVLALLGQGKSNKQIGDELAIADRTVRAHLTELFQNLGVQSRMQAVLRAQREGLIN